MRITGLIFAILLAIYLLNDARNKRRIEILVGLIITVAIGAVSINPAFANVLPDFLQLKNRLFSVLVASTLILFVLNYYLWNRLSKTRSETAAIIHAIARTDYQRNHQPQPLSVKSIYIVIPAYMEEKNILHVLHQLPRELLGYTLVPLVVVDGSFDNTERLVRGYGYRVATHVINRGQGAALITGFEIALSEGAEIIITMDADGQHRADDLLHLVRPLFHNEADYVMGTRILGEYENQGSARHAGILFFSRVISLLIGQKITDCTNGFRAIRADKLALMELQEQRFSAPELLIQAKANRLRIQEVPITILNRFEGESKKPKRLGYPMRFGLAMLRAWVRAYR